MFQEIDRKSIESNLLGNGVEFAGFINRQGRMIDYVCKNEINLSQEQKDMFFIGITLDNSISENHDGALGAVQCIVTERENSGIVSIPILTGTIVLILNKDTDIRTLVKRILKGINSVKNQNGNLSGLQILEYMVHD